MIYPPLVKGGSGGVGRATFACTTEHKLGAIDEFQRELITEGTREGRAAARARGRTGGRKPKLNDRQAATVRHMYAATGPDGKGSTRSPRSPRPDG